MGTAAACPLPQAALLLVAAPWLRDGGRICCKALVQPGGSEGREIAVLGGLCSATAQCQLPKISFSM